MILLTDEETLEISGASTELESFDWGEFLTAMKLGNKAQLKKVVEWLDRNSVDIIHNGIGSRVMPSRVWESLKEEAGL